MEAYPLSVRRRIIELYEEGMSTTEIADMFGYCVSGVRRIRQQCNETGSIAPKNGKRGRKPALDQRALERLAEAVSAKPDATLSELRDVVGVPVDLSVYCRYLQRMKLTRKKKSIHAQEQDRPDVKQQRERWHADLSDVRADQLVFIDESSATTDMQRRYGRSARGERCVAAGPQGHWKVATMIGAIRLDGPVTCAMLDGAVDGESFLAWVREDLCPALRPGDVVVMDNLSAHKRPAVRQTIEAAGAQLMYLPPYSPDYNPIENMWSKTKEALRAAAARTFNALGDAVSAALARVSAEDCRGFFQHAGYAIQNVKTL